MTNQTINFLGKTYALQPFPGSIADVHLTEQTGPELLTTYNIIAENLEMKKVRKFADKEAAVRRTWHALVEFDNVVKAEGSGEADEPAAPEFPEAERVAPKAAPKKPAAPKKAKVADGVTRYKGSNFNFPLNDPKEIKSVRANTNRGILVKMLTKGATFEDCLAATNWGEKRKDFNDEKARKACYEAIRLIHTYVGYGMKQDAETGIIRLITK